MKAPRVRNTVAVGDAPSRRFRELDEYRVDREWQRYEGNALRELFRVLRVRFLRRHRPEVAGPVLEIGPGPGRFSAELGDPDHPRILIDLSVRALRAARGHLSGRPVAQVGASEFVRGDARRLPVRPGRFSQCILLGNALGFAGGEGSSILAETAERLVAGGSLLLEVVAGAGEHSAYLRRLPTGAMRRTLAAPITAVLPRVDREGFLPQAERKRTVSEFRRYTPETLSRELTGLGLEVGEVLAVAPALGALPDRVEVVRRDPRAWDRLIELEEAIGLRPERWSRAAALLVAARRADGTGGRIK
ncbi:MAG TPA: class I SAM-dependent methyltransferase [Thermoplasmata archaeon]|nr:class I SAM-dependent methyltransferase [Thermoplasmata archaeon]